MGVVFISYRRDQTAGEARALYNDLTRLLGPGRVFMDVDDIALGIDFRDVLRQRVEECELMLVLIGRGWADAHDADGRRRLEQSDDFVRLEIATALERKIAITPVLLQNARMPTADSLPDELKPLAFRNGFGVAHATWESNVKELVRRLKLVPPEFGVASKAPLAIGAGVVVAGAVAAWMMTRPDAPPAPQVAASPAAPAASAFAAQQPAASAAANAPASAVISAAQPAPAPARASEPEATRASSAAPAADSAEIERLIGALDDRNLDTRTAAADQLIQRYAASAPALERAIELLAPGSFGRLQGGRIQVLRFLNGSQLSAWSPAQRAQVAEAVVRLRGAIESGRWKATEAARTELKRLSQLVSA